MTDTVIDLSTRVRGIMAAILRVPAADIGEDASPATIPGWDSLQHMKLVLALEEEFAVAYSEDQIIQMLGFPSIVRITGELLSSR